MTLFELITACLVLASAAVGSYALGFRFGVPGYIAGALAGPGGLYLIFRIAIFLENFLWGGIPRFPPCENGVCTKEDYHVVESALGIAFQCNCGAVYVKNGRRFLKVVPQLPTPTPFLIWVPFKGWLPDSGKT